MKRALIVISVVSAIALPVAAQDAAATRAEIGEMFGGVPTFVSQVADSALPGLWAQTMQLEMSGETALDPKTKALISLAVAAQIPCTYCVWIDTRTARENGATDQEVAEAVAIAGLTRNWSTVFNGMQVDLEQFKAELGGD